MEKGKLCNDHQDRHKSSCFCLDIQIAIGLFYGRCGNSLASEYMDQDLSYRFPKGKEIICSF